MQQKAHTHQPKEEGRLAGLLEELEAEGVSSELSATVLLVYAVDELLDVLADQFGPHLRDQILDRTIVRTRNRLMKRRHLWLVE